MYNISFASIDDLVTRSVSWNIVLLIAIHWNVLAFCTAGKTSFCVKTVKNISDSCKLQISTSSRRAFYCPANAVPVSSWNIMSYLGNMQKFTNSFTFPNQSKLTKWNLDAENNKQHKVFWNSENRKIHVTLFRRWLLFLTECLEAESERDHSPSPRGLGKGSFLSITKLMSLLGFLLVILVCMYVSEGSAPDAGCVRTRCDITSSVSLTFRENMRCSLEDCT